MDIHKSSERATDGRHDANEDTIRIAERQRARNQQQAVQDSIREEESGFSVESSVASLQQREGGNQTPNVQNMDVTQGMMSNNLNKSVNRSAQMNQSARQRREVKKLQKYDSNSIDEEEFQDYFSNPQKRKEFDRQRLQQQMREIQNIAGFSLGQFGGKSMKSMRDAFPAYPGADVDQGGQNLQQKNYATVSLCCLSVTNPVRNKIIQIVTDSLFDKIILVVIVVNSLVLALDNEVYIITKYAEDIDFIFLIIYTIEMILKIIAMGFFMRAHSYLRDTWNVLDFLVVILGWISLNFATDDGADISAIRVIRILRPLRTINSMPGMSGLVSTILNSLPIMFDIMVLFCFMLIMFGTIATQLLGGRLQNRCFAPNIYLNTDSHLLGENAVELFCMPGAEDDCDSRKPPDVVAKAYCKQWKNPIQDTFNFDNILMSIFNIFQIITLEGWTSMMYIIRKSERTYLYDLFFISCVLFGAFFVLNLMIAVQFTYLGEAFDEEERRQKEIQEKINIRKKLKMEQEQDDSFFDDEEESQNENSGQMGEQDNSQDPENRRSSTGDKNNNQGQRKQSTKKKGCCQYKPPMILVKWSNAVEEVVNTPRFGDVIIGFIILNTVFLAAEHYQQPDWLSFASSIANVIFTVIFALEMVLKLFGLGIRKYVEDGFNIFDGVIVCVSLFELFFQSESSGLSVLRAFRLLRVFKIIKSWSSLRILLSTVLESLSSITNLGVLTLLFLFINSLLAKQFYSNELMTEDGESSRYSFRSTAMSLITFFIILTGENWNEIMVQVISSSKTITGPAIFFSLMMILGNYMLLNLFLAILLKFISDNGDDDCAHNDEEEAKSVKNKSDKGEDMFASQKNGASSGKGIAVNNEGLDDSQPLNSSNSNIEEEFEQIKLQLQQLSSMNLNEAQRMKNGKSKKDEMFEGGNRSNRRNQYRDDNSQGSSEMESQRRGNSRSRQSGRNNEGGSRRKRQEDSQDMEDQQNNNGNQSQNGTGVNDFKKDKVMPINHIHLKTFAARSVKSMGKKKQKKQIDIDENSRSLFIFQHDNIIRVTLKNLVENPYFEGFIYHMIAFNSLLLALDHPILTDPYQDATIQLMLTIISVIFIVECVVKIIVMGFYFGEMTYLRDSWNVLDFIIVFFSVVTFILNMFDGLDIGFVRGFRALRALRPLRVVSKNEGIKTVVNSLAHSIPSLLNVMLIILLFLLVFGILGVQLFKGGIGMCNDEDPRILNKQMCIGWFWEDRENNFGQKIGSKRTLRSWDVPFNNYNNVLYSMITFFEISTLEMWPDNMFNAIDSVGIDKRMKYMQNLSVSIVFIIYIFLTTFFVMNLFISVIVDKFNEEIKKRQGAHNFTEEQKEWVKIQRLLVHTNPKIIPVEPINCFRLQCFKIVQSQAFEYVIMLAIVVNTCFLCIDYYQKSEELARILSVANSTFVVIFTLEMIFKITAYGFKYYWHVNWNKFDFIIVILSLAAIDEQIIASLNINISALRIIRVSRLLRMVKTSEGLRSLLKTLYMSLGNILTTSALLLLILFTFTVAGMSLFGEIQFGEHINEDANFTSFYLSMITLWRACTGESWNGIMHECWKSQGMLAIIFWLSFQLFTFFIFMNVFIAVIYENFNDIQASEDENDILSLKKKDIKAFQNTWAKYNPMGELYMRTLRLPDFLRELPPPLGYQGIRIEESKLNKIIFCLNIKDHLGRVYYPEVMWTIFHSIVGINDEKVNNCEQIINILKIVKKKYKGLGKKVNLDSLCGNKYYRNELTAIKYIQAMKILTKWRNFKNIRIKQKEQQMMKQLTGAQPAAINEIPEKKPLKSLQYDDAPIQQIQQSKKKEDSRRNKHQEESQQQISERSNHNDRDYIKNKRLENIQKQVQKNKEYYDDDVEPRNTRRKQQVQQDESEDDNVRANNRGTGRSRRNNNNRQQDESMDNSFDNEADQNMGITDRNPMSARPQAYKSGKRRNPSRPEYGQEDMSGEEQNARKYNGRQRSYQDDYDDEVDQNDINIGMRNNRR